MPRLSRHSVTGLLALTVTTMLSVGPAAHAQDDINPVAMALNMFGDSQFIAGGTYTVQVQIDAQGVTPDNLLAAMGVLITPPPGWVYTGTIAGPLGGPDIEPRSGSSVLEFAWINPPVDFPYEFAFTLGIPRSEEGTRFISGQGLYRTTGPELYTAPIIITTEGPDNTPPVIELVGDNPLQWPLGEPFVDPGYTATDSADGDLTSQVNVLGFVDHTNAGTYTLTYVGVADSSGNRGANVTREVIVGDFGNNPTDDGDDPNTPNDGGSSVNNGGSVAGGFVGGNRGNRNGRNAFNGRNSNDDDKSKRARNSRNANRNARNAAPSKTAALAQRLADQNRRNMAARNSNTRTPTQIVIPKSSGQSAGARIGEAMRDAAEAAKKNDGVEAPDYTATTTPTAGTPPGPRGVPYSMEDIEGEETIEMANLDAAAAPVVNLDTETDSGALATITGALRDMGPRQYIALGSILVVLLAAALVGAIAWKSAYRSTPRRRTEPEAGTGD